MLMAKALARWEGEGGALSARWREDDAHPFRGRERSDHSRANTFTTAPSLESGK